MSAEGFSDGVFAYFVHRIQKNLHVCLLMDPTNEQFEVRVSRVSARCPVRSAPTPYTPGAAPRAVREDPAFFFFPPLGKGILGPSRWTAVGV